MHVGGPSTPLAAVLIHIGSSPQTIIPCVKHRAKHHYKLSKDSDLEAFSRNPTDGSFAELTSQSTALTKDLNEVFLSY